MINILKKSFGDLLEIIGMMIRMCAIFFAMFGLMFAREGGYGVLIAWCISVVVSIIGNNIYKELNKKV